MGLANYDLLAVLFGYPGPSFETDLVRASEYCEADYPAAARSIREFGRLVPKGDLLAQQELYTRTFDVQPITSLDIGYTLFGEDYKRGALLANLSAEHKRAGIDCGIELGDHLTNVLKLLPRLSDASFREEFVQVLLGPALREMVREFEPGRLAKKEELYKKHHKTIISAAEGELRTAYRHLFEALQVVLQADFALRVSLP